MRKFFMALLILAMTVCGVIGIAACGEKEKPDESQNQGQVQPNKDKEEDKDKDNETQKPSTGEENKPSAGETTPGDKEDEGSKGDEGEVNPPHNPEENPQTKPDEGKEDEGKEDGNPTTPENPGEKDPEENPDDEPQGDDPSADEPEKPNPDEDKPGADEPEKDEPKPEEPGKDEPKPEEPTEHEHSWTYTASTGTDTSNAYHVKTCSVCKTSVTEKCVFDAPTLVDPTCTEDGYKGYTCRNCKQLLKVAFFDGGRPTKLKTGHKFTEWEYVAGSGATTPKHSRHCTNEGCNEVETQDCTIEGQRIEPTCDKAGSDTRKCKTCNFELKTLDPSSLNKLEHELTYTYSTYSGTHTAHCSRPCCAQKVFQPQQCDFQKVEETEPTCESTGTIISRCKTCGNTKVTPKEGTALGHEYKNTNFCVKCGKDGLTAEMGKIDVLNFGKIIFPEGMRNVKKIIIGEDYLNLKAKMYALVNDSLNGFNNLEDIFIPTSIIVIQKDAFKGCSSLNTIYYEGTQNDWNKIAADGQVRDMTYAKDEVKKDSGGDFNFQYSQNATTLKEQWEKDSPSASTVIALPAGDRKIYA